MKCLVSNFRRFFITPNRIFKLSFSKDKSAIKKIWYVNNLNQQSIWGIIFKTPVFNASTFPLFNKSMTRLQKIQYSFTYSNMTLQYHNALQRMKIWFKFWEQNSSMLHWIYSLYEIFSYFNELKKIVFDHLYMYFELLIGS